MRARLSRLQVFREQGVEVIVIDGGSTDGSQELAGPLVDKLLVSGRGRALQMNTGAESAQGEWLVFLHLDTELPELALSVLRQATADATCSWGWFDVEMENRAWPFRMIAACMNARARVTRVCTGDQTLFVQRSLFSAVGGFPAIPLMEDVAISKLLRSRARPAVLDSRVRTSSRRWEKHGILRTILLMWRLRLLYFLGVEPERLLRRYYPHQGPEQASSGRGKS